MISNSCTTKNFWLPFEIDEEFIKQNDAHVKKKTIDLSAKQFSSESFMSFLNLLKKTEIKKITLNKSLVTEEQSVLILKLINSNEMKGVKLVDEEGNAFGAVYTDWHNYNLDKAEACTLGMRETTKVALSYLNLNETPYLVFDFGAGTGQDTIPLLDIKGFQVIAIDGDEEALEILRSALKENQRPSVEFYTGAFIHFNYGQQADLLISSFTWPYRPKEDFQGCWQKTLEVVKPNGLIAGHFFGPPETCDMAMTYHTEEELKELLEKDFEILWFQTKNVPIYGGEISPWGELYHVVARKKT